jgi:hypothetical protein
MKFIKVTNSTPAHKGKELAVRADIIISLHRDSITRDNGIVETVTFIHAPPNGNWEVSETIPEILKQLEQ